MNAAAFKNPFAEVDFTKIVGDFKFPMMNVETLVEAQRKNIAVITAANQSAFEAFKGIAQRQVDMVKASMEDFSRAASEVMSAATVEEKAAKQADVVKAAYANAIANAKELGDLYAKTNTEAFDSINKRVVEVFDEVKALVAKK